MSAPIEILGAEMRVVEALRNAPGGLTCRQVSEVCGWASEKMKSSLRTGGTRANQMLASLRRQGLATHTRTRPPVWTLTDLATTAHLVRIYQRVSEETKRRRSENLAAAREALAKSQDAAKAAVLEDDEIDRYPIKRSHIPAGQWTPHKGIRSVFEWWQHV